MKTITSKEYNFFLNNLWGKKTWLKQSYPVSSLLYRHFITIEKNIMSHSVLFTLVPLNYIAKCCYLEACLCTVFGWQHHAVGTLFFDEDREARQR